MTCIPAVSLRWKYPTAANTKSESSSSVLVSPFKWLFSPLVMHTSKIPRQICDYYALRTLKCFAIAKPLTLVVINRQNSIMYRCGPFMIFQRCSTRTQTYMGNSAFARSFFFFFSFSQGHRQGEHWAMPPPPPGRPQRLFGAPFAIVRRLPIANVFKGKM